jgi:hypothetical protein
MNGNTLPSVFPLHVHIGEPEPPAYLIALVISFHCDAAYDNVSYMATSDLAPSMYSVLFAKAPAGFVNT